MAAVAQAQIGSIALADTFAPADFEALFRALDAFNSGVVGPASFRPLVILMKDAAGQPIGGLWGRTGYDWLAIQMLFVPEPLRHRRLGSALIRLAEQEARRRHCVGVQVDTFSFQARGFYEKQGFTVFGVQENLPPGHRCFYLSKALNPPAGHP